MRLDFFSFFYMFDASKCDNFFVFEQNLSKKEDLTSFIIQILR